MNATPDPNMLLSQKALLRRAIRDALKQISVQEKLHQTNTVIDHLINKHDRFRRSKHIAVYLAMKHEEIDTVPLIERVLTDPQLKSQHRLYVPHIEPKSDMVFYELESLDQYNHQMNTNNKFNIKQFNDVSSLKPAREHDIDLVLVPGLGFDFDPRQESDNSPITRMGRGKGYYDRFLRQLRPDCFTVGIGFNQQYLPLNQTLRSRLDNNQHLPVNESYDVRLNQFLCENLINNF